MKSPEAEAHRIAALAAAQMEYQLKAQKSWLADVYGAIYLKEINLYLSMK